MTPANVSSAVLEIRGLTVSLPPGSDRSLAVEDISLSVHPREIVCIVGESGSGKSVTSFAVMRLLASSLKAVAGEIWFEGQNLLKASSEELRHLRGNRLSMIFQEPMTALSPTMTVGRQIEEVLIIHTSMNREARSARVHELLELVNIPDPLVLGKRYPHQLSGGQRQRIMIAMALAMEPALLIADEPTTALDVTTQAQILEKIKEIQRRSNTAVLFVTHDLGVVSDIADRVVVMQKGKVVEQGPVADVIGAPKHPYTQSLLAAIPGIRNRVRKPPIGDTPEVLTVAGLSKTYHSTALTFRTRSTQAVDDISLVIRRGETLAVVGESGSGKSTMARCICGLIDPSSGRIHIQDGKPDPSNDRRERKQQQLVQIIFQDPNRSLDPRWTAGQSMIEGMRNIGVPRGEAMSRARLLIEKVGLGPSALERYPHEFSGGQRQRISIARAISMEPSLLIADEAVSALDVSVQAQVLNLLASLQQEFQLSILFITHDLRVAVQISDNIAVMHKGRIVELGPALDVYQHPKHDYSRVLFKSAPGKL